MNEKYTKSLKLVNFATGNKVHDSLHTKAKPVNICSASTCGGSVVFSKRASVEPRSKEEVLTLAQDFIDEYYSSIKSEQRKQRWDQVRSEIQQNGTYELTQTELVYGAKLAWRNAPRCIGRIQWSKLQVFDARYVTSASGMFEALCKHIKYGTNKGNIRSAITVFPQRTDGLHDFRVWNAQLVSYACYRNQDGSVTGDPLNLEFTELCMKLGWKGKRTRWDILPLVLSAGGQDPEWFDIPPELVMQVPITHPEYDWFKELNLRWYALPAVSSLLFDCGGLQFTGAPFNGWYMASEIAARDLCDIHRFNMAEELGKRMGLDTSTNMNLWKDKAVVDMNVAVLFSFQKHKVTIVDHHTAAESFMKHFENEQRVRGGCPADWVWIVPPISGSVTPVFHQEMSVYHLKPSYDYQEVPWKTHVWKKHQDIPRSVRKSKRKFRFKEIARAVKFTSKLFGKALSKRIKATIIYATETGKSENYARKLCEIFGHTFNAQVRCMSDYDFIDIEHEALVLVVTSTFGNGDPPENGESFAKNLYAMKLSGSAAGADNYDSLIRSMSFIRRNGGTDLSSPLTPSDKIGSIPFNFSPSVPEKEVNNWEMMGPLSNLRFAVFALGSSAYPNFCNFGKYLDSLLGDLGGERLIEVTCGDELAGQDQQFKKWAAQVFKVGCDTFCLDDEVAILEATAALKTEQSASAHKVKMVPAPEETPITAGLSKTHAKKVRAFEVAASRNLHGENASRWTQQVVLRFDSRDKDTEYQPGDHVAILPANRKSLVDALLRRFSVIGDPDRPVQIMVMKEVHTPNGVVPSWEPHDRLPIASVRKLFSRYLDITTPPSASFLLLLARHAKDQPHKERLEHLASDPHDYEEWKHLNFPHIPEVLEEFSSVDIEPALFLSQLPPLQPRFYSISSSHLVHKGEIHLTVAVVTYQTQGGYGPVHYGVCSNYLKDLTPGQTIEGFVRSCSSFHLPEDPSRPVILVGPGTGVAPFRGFWHHRHYLKNFLNDKVGDMTLFFGCRTQDLDLYHDEKAKMVADGVLTNSYLALSREPSQSKMYVQDMLVKVGRDVYRKMVLEGGHLFVCGDCTMAECVYQRLKGVIQEHGGMTDAEVENYMLNLRDEERYHEDIFGITLRTEEVHRQTREFARTKKKSESQMSVDLS